MWTCLVVLDTTKMLCDSVLLSKILSTYYFWHLLCWSAWIMASLSPETLTGTWSRLLTSKTNVSRFLLTRFKYLFETSCDFMDCWRWDCGLCYHQTYGGFHVEIRHRFKWSISHWIFIIMRCTNLQRVKCYRKFIMVCHRGEYVLTLVSLFVSKILQSYGRKFLPHPQTGILRGVLVFKNFLSIRANHQKVLVSFDHWKPFQPCKIQYTMLHAWAEFARLFCNLARIEGNFLKTSKPLEKCF